MAYSLGDLENSVTKAADLWEKMEVAKITTPKYYVHDPIGKLKDQPSWKPVDPFKLGQNPENPCGEISFEVKDWHFDNSALDKLKEAAGKLKKTQPSPLPVEAKLLTSENGKREFLTYFDPANKLNVVVPIYYKYYASEYDLTQSSILSSILNMAWTNVVSRIFNNMIGKFTGTDNGKPSKVKKDKALTDPNAGGTKQ